MRGTDSHSKDLKTIAIQQCIPLHYALTFKHQKQKQQRKKKDKRLSLFALVSPSAAASEVCQWKTSTHPGDFLLGQIWLITRSVAALKREKTGMESLLVTLQKMTRRRRRRSRFGNDNYLTHLEWSFFYLYVLLLRLGKGPSEMPQLWSPSSTKSAETCKSSSSSSSAAASSSTSRLLSVPIYFLNVTSSWALWGGLCFKLLIDQEGSKSILLPRGQDDGEEEEEKDDHRTCPGLGNNNN